MRLKKEEEKAQAAENTIRLQQAREESRKQAAMLAEAKRLAQITAEKPAPVIMPAPVAVSAPKVEPVPKAAQPPASQKTQKAEQVDAKKATETRDVETLKTTQGAVHVPAELPPSSLNTALKKETGPLVNVAQDLGAIMPAPAELTVGQEPEVPVVVESGKRLIERLLGAGTASRSGAHSENHARKAYSRKASRRNAGHYPRLARRST
jgi:hypothetical protein